MEKQKMIEEITKKEIEELTEKKKDRKNEEKIDTEKNKLHPLGCSQSQATGFCSVSPKPRQTPHSEIKISDPSTQGVEVFSVGYKTEGFGDKSKIMEIIKKIQDFLKNELFLNLENRKIQINKIKFGIDFVGYVGFKHYTRIRTKNYRRFMKKFKKKAFLHKKHRLSNLKFYSSFISYLGHLKYTNSKKIKIKIISFYIETSHILSEGKTQEVEIFSHGYKSERLGDLYAITLANKQSRAVKRGGNWNNGANAGLFYANLNNVPSNTNTNIGFRCCSENQADALFLRKCCQPDVHRLLQSSEGLLNILNLQMKTRAGIKQHSAVIPAMNLIKNEEKNLNM